MPMVGFLRAGQPPKSWVEAFQQGLRERGYVDGQNVVVQFRSTDGSFDQLPWLAEELVRLKVNVILASGAPPALAAKKVTTSVPIVFVGVILPIELGLVPSLGHPADNITGLAVNAADQAGKRLELLKELVPKVRRVAVLWDRGNPTNQLQLEGAEVAARALGMQLEPVSIRSPNDFDAGFTYSVPTVCSCWTAPYSRRIALELVGLAATSRLPAIHVHREFMEVGGLMSYGAHVPELYRRAATYVDKILKGAKPADLPVEQPTKFELLINLKTAKALDLTIPPILLARADEIME